MSLEVSYPFKNIENADGKLVVIESARNLPFEIKRTYFIMNVRKGESRGFHAHKELRQVAVCLKGSCKMILDDGINKQTVAMNSTKEGLLIDKMIWHEMHEFSDDCILAVFADDYYDEEDYIRSYDCFLEKGE